MKTLLTASEIAEHLQITRRTVYTLAKSGTLPAIRVGGQWRFPVDSKQKFVSIVRNVQREQDSASENTVESHNIS